MWLLYTLLACLFGAVQILAKRKLLKDNKELHHIIVATLYVGFSMSALFYVLLTDASGILPGSLKPIIWHVIGGGILYGSVLCVDTYVLGHVDAAVSGIINKLTVVTVLVGGAFILEEYLSGVQLVGAAIILISSLLVVQRRRSKEVKVDRFVLLLAANTIAVGLAAVNEKYMLGQVSLSTYMVFGWGAQTVFVLGYALIRQQQVRPLIPRGYITKGLLLGLLQFGLGINYMKALMTSDNQPLVISVLGVNVLLITLGGVLFLNEKAHLKKKIIASVLGVIGVTIIAFAG